MGDRVASGGFQRGGVERGSAVAARSSVVVSPRELAAHACTARIVASSPTRTILSNLECSFIVRIPLPGRSRSASKTIRPRSEFVGDLRQLVFDVRLYSLR